MSKVFSAHAVSVDDYITVDALAERAGAVMAGRNTYEDSDRWGGDGLAGFRASAPAAPVRHKRSRARSSPDPEVEGRIPGAACARTCLTRRDATDVPRGRSRGAIRPRTDVLIRDYLEPVPMNAGEAIIFDDSLIHWSAQNDSAHPRIAIQAMCIPADATPLFFCKADDEQFELIHADREFFLEQGPGDLQSRQPHWTGLGYIDNPNRPISEREFASLLRQGDQTRAALDQPPVLPVRKRRNWFGRSRSRRG